MRWDEAELNIVTQYSTRQHGYGSELTVRTYQLLITITTIQIITFLHITITTIHITLFHITTITLAPSHHHLHHWHT